MQVSHLSAYLRDVDASNLRFTVYTRDTEGDGRVVEILNTGMVEIVNFDVAGGVSGSGALRQMRSEVVLDFEDDVSCPCI